VLLMFLDERGKLLEPETNVELMRAWLEPFRPFVAQSWVRAYLMSTTKDNGHFVPPDDVAETVAAALVADLVLPGVDAPRLLTDVSLEPEVSLSTFGLRALEYRPESLVDHIWRRCLRDLLKNTGLARGRPRSVDATDLVKSARGLLQEAFPEKAEFGAELWFDGSATPIPDEAPALTGAPVCRQAFKVTLQLRSMAQGATLDRSARRTWPAQLVEWDAPVRESRLDRLVQQVSTALEGIESRFSDSLADRLARLFVVEGGVRDAVKLCGQIGDSVESQYSMFVHEGDSPVLEESLARLDRGLQGIPHLPSLWTRTILLLGLQAYLAWLVWTMASPASRGVPLLMIGIAALITLAIAPWTRWHREKLAQEAKNRVLDNTATRAQRTFAFAIQRRFERLRDIYLARAKHCRRVLTELLDDLERLSRQQPPAQTSAPMGLVREWPQHGQIEELYGIFSERELSPAGDGDLIARFRSFLHEGVRKVLTGEMDRPELADRLEQFVRRELRRFCGRYQLWHFLCSRIDDGELDPALAKRALQPLGDNFPFANLQGVPVEDGLLDPYRCEEFCLAPKILQDFVPHDRRPLEAATPNLVALASRVELVRLAAADDDSPGEDVQPDGAEVPQDERADS
jgi:hypothetical protein